MLVFGQFRNFQVWGLRVIANGSLFLDDFYGNLGATLKSRNDISELNFLGNKQKRYLYRQNIVSTSEKEGLVGDTTCVGS